MSVKLNGPFIPHEYDNSSLYWTTVWIEAVQLNHSIGPSNISLLEDKHIVYEKVC